MSEVPVTGEVLDESDERDSEFVCGNCGAGIPDSHVGPNPTDEQVEAALHAWMANDEEYGDVAMRAALRAAGCAR